MTLTDAFHGIESDAVDFMEKSPCSAMCDLVSSALAQAAREGRLTHGLGSCASALSSSPSDVVICVLPLDAACSNVNLNIQMLLIESVCLEYDILTVKLDVNQINSVMNSAVSSAADMAKILAEKNSDVSSELSCFLIKLGEDGLTFHEKKLVHTFQSYADTYPE